MQHYEDIKVLAHNPRTRITACKGLEDGTLYVLKRTSCLSSNSKAVRLRAAYAVQEARLLLLLKHPNIVRGYDFFTDGENFCLVQELCPLGDLQKLLDAAATKMHFLTLATLLSLALQAVDAVSFLHQHGILHRDLKPSNLFLSRREQHLLIKLGDFGGARKLQAEQQLVTNAGRVGTQHYMAPEVEQQIGYSKRADVWSTGVVLIEACLLQTLNASSLRPLKPKFIQEVANRYPRFQPLLTAMVNLDPGRRPECAYIQGDLRAIQSELGVGSCAREDYGLHDISSGQESVHTSPLHEVMEILGLTPGTDLDEHCLLGHDTLALHTDDATKRKRTPISWLASVASRVWEWGIGDRRARSVQSTSKQNEIL